VIVRLASASPRRRQLLEWAGVHVVVDPPDVDESWVPGEHPADAAERLARAKALARPTPELTLAADTVVHLDGKPFGKPVDPDEAIAFLSALSGAWHEVTTGVALRSDDGTHSLRVSTAVRFRTLERDEIHRYVLTGEPMDKAGAYAIQGLGGALVAELRGSWTNVMGLPLEQTLAALRAAGWTP
jgi:septum formation protein